MGNCQNFPTDDNRKSSSKSRGKPQIVIKSYTWSRDSHGLFDYESKSLNKKNLKAYNSARVARNGNDIHLLKENDQVGNKNYKDLLKLMLKEGNYYVGNCFESPAEKKLGSDNLEDPEQIENGVWLVVRSFKAQSTNKTGFKLNENDLIKLGRMKFRIREMKTTVSPNSQKPAIKPEIKTKEEELSKDDGKNAKSTGSLNNSMSKAEIICRICFTEGGEPDNPLITPCNCSGTMKHIHLQCLQQWLKTKLHTKVSGNSVSIIWKILECELCKKVFPHSFDVSGKTFDLVTVEKPECPYIILDILHKDKNNVRGIHVIKMEGKNNIRLGRGHDSDIRITDISVSRCHALIKLEKGSFYIEDNNSKFGTLVYLKKMLPISGDFSNISFQIGRTMLNVTVKKNWKLLPACFSNGNDANTSGESDNEDNGDSGLRGSLTMHRNANDGPRIGSNHNGLNQGDNPNPEEIQEGELDDSIESEIEDNPPENPGDQGQAQNNQNRPPIEQANQNGVNPPILPSNSDNSNSNVNNNNSGGDAPSS